MIRKGSGELGIGDKAPDFALKDFSGKVHRLSKSRGKRGAVIFFYPRDNTPGCTVEAKGFNKTLKKFENLGVNLFGISGGDEKSKSKFCDKHSLKVTLLSDSDFSVAKSYGAFGKKSFMGMKFEGIFRKTYIVDSKGKLVHIFNKVNPLGHEKEVLKVVCRLLVEEEKAS